MTSLVFEIIGWVWVVFEIVILVLTATRKNLRGKAWLIGFLGTGFAITLTYRIADLVQKFDLVDSLSTFYEWCNLPLNILSLAGYCLLIPYVLKAGRKEMEQPELPESNQDALGIGGWLVFPAIGLILGPIVTIVSLTIAFGLFEDVTDAGYGGVYALNILVEIGLFVFIIFAATRFFGKKVNAPTTMITLMIVQVVATAICLAIEISAEAEMMAVESGKALVRGIISAAIWIPYFRVSDRVKKTFVK